LSSSPILWWSRPNGIASITAVLAVWIDQARPRFVQINLVADVIVVWRKKTNDQAGKRRAA
jgi:hypothetical protein